MKLSRPFKLQIVNIQWAYHLSCLSHRLPITVRAEVEVLVFIYIRSIFFFFFGGGGGGGGGAG